MFEKINDYKFIYKLSTEEKSEIDKIIKKLSSGFTYNNLVNYSLFLSLVSRLVGSKFLESEYAKDLNMSKEVQYASIDVYIEERKEIITIGSIDVGNGNIEFINGVLY